MKNPESNIRVPVPRIVLDEIRRVAAVSGLKHADVQRLCFRIDLAALARLANAVSRTAKR
jgi:hypothetical protein